MKRHIMTRLTYGIFLLFACIAAPLSAQAADAPTRPMADKPEAATSRTTRVAITHEGTDTLGTKLAFEVKNTFNTSSLFSLSEKSEPKIRLYLSTVAEFPSRPGIGSAYGAVWVFSQSDNTLGFLLARETGLVTPDELPGLVVKLAERTDGIAARYGYLFTK